MAVSGSVAGRIVAVTIAHGRHVMMPRCESRTRLSRASWQVARGRLTGDGDRPAARRASLGCTALAASRAASRFRFCQPISDPFATRCAPDSAQQIRGFLEF